MNQKERLAICSSCTHRKLDFALGYVCQLTGRFADFNGTCSHYELDETVTDTIQIRTKERPWVPLFDPVPENAETGKKKKATDNKRPSEVVLKKLRKYQSFPYALIGGLLFTAAAALGCAIFTATTGYRGVYMVLGVGLLIGLAVRYFGAGINWVFGFLAALLTLAGSLLGYYLSQAGVPEEMQLAGIIRVPDYLSPDLMINTMRDTFVPLDLLFYGLTALLGYLLAIRRVSTRRMARLERDGYKGAPALYWLRLPLILVLILLPAYYVYTQTNQDTGGYSTLYYESGQKMSEGEIRNGVETGEWTCWHENGNMKSIGYYINGKKDSLWKWYDESGILTATGMYRDGVENGTWIHYYPDGVVSDSGAYLYGLKEGIWKYFHRIGSLRSAVNFTAGRMHGEKILLSASGNVVNTEYFEHGMLIEKE